MCECVCVFVLDDVCIELFCGGSLPIDVHILLVGIVIIKSLVRFTATFIFKFIDSFTM